MRFIPFVLCWVFFHFSCVESENISDEKFIIGYVFPGDKILVPEDIPANKFTHINYAFSNIENGKVVEGFENDEQNYKILNSLKIINPDLKIFSSVGGWSWSGDFSDAALTVDSRSVFAKSARLFLVKHQLDGIDIDWEYPNLPGDDNIHRPEDIKNFTLLMKEIRKELDAQGKLDHKHYLTSAACGGFLRFIENTEMAEVYKYMDFVNLMTYDQYTGSDKITGHHSSLYTNPNDPKKISSSLTVNQYIEAGVPAEKIILGFPFYGRAWGNVERTNHGLYQKGSQTRLNSSHNAIVETHLMDSSNFKRYWDDQAQAPFLWNETEQIFVSYDDIESVTKKCDFIHEKELKGAMFWAFGSDYKNSILNTLNIELRPSQDRVNNNNPGAGFRFSSYGSGNEILDMDYWKYVGLAMSEKFKDSTPECIWIVSPLSGRGSRLSFPAEVKDTLIKTSPDNKYEESFNLFDSLGFRVWLQIEPGFASVDELLQLVLKQYSHHDCIIGVGVDVEWYNSINPDEGQTVTNEEALRWLQIAKSFNPEYKLFLKHWLKGKMPPDVRKDIVFINDSQQLSCMEQMLKEFIDWGEAFYPSKVGFQYGYPSDRKWWSKYENPPKKLGGHILANIPNTSSLFWVNTGITEVFPLEDSKE